MFYRMLREVLLFPKQSTVEDGFVFYFKVIYRGKNDQSFKNSKKTVEELRFFLETLYHWMIAHFSFSVFKFSGSFLIVLTCMIFLYQLLVPTRCTMYLGFVYFNINKISSYKKRSFLDVFCFVSFFGMLGKHLFLVIVTKAMAFGLNGDFLLEQSSIILNKLLSLLDLE